MRALQDEIEKLKEGVRSAHEKASERPQHLPPSAQLPPPPQNKEEGPDYYDPFDDPYGFMRMPRRRANSFSGGRVREFDEWYWTLPHDKRNEDDIPLGYAAADAYNRHHRDKTPEAARQRLRQRRGERERRRGRGDETAPKSVDDGVGAEVEGVGGIPSQLPPPNAATLPAQPGAQIRRPPISDPQALYNYYVPSRHGAHAASSNPYRQHTTPLYSSQPNLSQTLAGVQPTTHQYYHQQQQQQPHQQQQQQQKQPWYTIRRSQWPAASAQYYPTTGGGYQQQGSAQATPTAATPIYYGSSYASSGSTTPVGYRTESCPLCGGVGAHFHEEDVEPVHGYSAHDFATQPG